MNLSKKFLAPLAMSFAISAAASTPSFAQSNDNAAPNIDNNTMSFSCDTPDLSSLSRPDRIENILPATVLIQVQKQGQPTMQNPTGRGSGLGSGFIVDKDSGYIVTNNHVIDGATDISVVLYDPSATNNKGERHEVTLVGTDPVLDVAVLKLDTGEPLRSCVNFGNSDHVRQGDDVMVIGNPQGLSFSTSFGIVSNTQRHIGNWFYNYIQTDSSINPGNSGGGLYNLSGEVVGINAMIMSRAGESNGLGISIKSNDAIEVVDEIIRTGEAQRADYGFITLGSVTPEKAEELGGYVGEGMIIDTIAQDSPTALAGLREDDIIMKIDGQPVKGIREALRLLGTFEPTDTIDFQIIRDRMLQTVTVDFAAKPEEAPEVIVADAATLSDETPEAEAETPEAAAPEAEAPEAETPEAKDPEAETPEPEAPAEAPKDEAPETEAPEVKDPEAEAPIAETPEAPETPEAAEQDNAPSAPSAYYPPLAMNGPF